MRSKLINIRHNAVLSFARIRDNLFQQTRGPIILTQITARSSISLISLLHSTPMLLVNLSELQTWFISDVFSLRICKSTTDIGCLLMSLMTSAMTSSLMMLLMLLLMLLLMMLLVMQKLWMWELKQNTRMTRDFTNTYNNNSPTDHQHQVVYVVSNYRFASLPMN